MEKISRQRRSEGAWRDIVERQGPAAIWIPDYEPRFSHAYYIAPRPAVCASWFENVEALPGLFEQRAQVLVDERLVIAPVIG